MANISVFDIFKIGIGPSSSHTVGPMKAAKFFVEELEKQEKLLKTDSLVVELYGSLALTKSGHGTDIALQLGLLGYTPENINPKNIDNLLDKIRQTGRIVLNQKKEIIFSPDESIKMFQERLPYHPNGIIIRAFNDGKEEIFSEEYYSVGGGFVEIKSELLNRDKHFDYNFPFPFFKWRELKEICQKEKKEPWEIVLKNELSIRDETRVNRKLAKIYHIMRNGIRSSLKRDGELKGGLGLERRSKALFEQLQNKEQNPLTAINYLMLWGLALGEENASYGKIITSPTNGAAGIIPAVVNYYKEYCSASFQGYKKLMLTAAIVGNLCKQNASISGAEGGCQAEIGTATAMAAAGLCSALGGNMEQCENAAIMALTHNLGLVCDPVGGLVQIPCIERNAINAVKAVSCASLALLEAGSKYLDLDTVITTMGEIGRDMSPIYRETALGGLAKNAPTSRRCGGGCSGCPLK